MSNGEAVANQALSPAGTQGDTWMSGEGLARLAPSRGPRPARLPAKLVVQSDAHYCIARSAGILGLGTDHVVKAPLDDRRRMDPVRLDAILSELRGAGHQFAQVVTLDGDRSELARAALSTGYATSDKLVREYTNQLLTARHTRQGPLDASGAVGDPLAES